MLKWFLENPLEMLWFMLYRAPAVLLAIVIHEWAHGYVAFRAGDPTAKMMGRLTLNPLKHLDFIGTLSLFILGFGWAKPVPVNPSFFKNGKKDDLKVSLAGVTVNFIAFIIFTFISIVLCRAMFLPEVTKAVGGVGELVRSGTKWHAVQLFPQYGKELSALLRTPWLLHVQRFVLHAAQINLGMCVFNLLPLPPLDGFHVVNDVLLGGRIVLGGRIFQIAQAVLLVLIFATDVFSNIVVWVMEAVQAGVLQGMLKLFGM